MNIGTYSENIDADDLVVLMDDWKKVNKFCLNIKVLEVDDPRDAEFIVFEGCNLESLEYIFCQCPYLVLTLNEEETFRHTGVNLKIAFLLTVIWLGDS